MTETETIEKGYHEIFGGGEINISPLPKSGSDRKYFRIVSGGISVIGTLNPVREENEAFIGFTRHFREKGLPVPEIFGYIPEKNIYFLQDLGDLNLFTWLRKNSSDEGFSQSAMELFHRILDNLIIFQVRGIEGLDLGLCYPHRSFDRQSMIWDMNYFKYMLLRLLAVPFNEQRLENDFSSLADYLLEEGQYYFLYRDFQSANIMIVGEEPWFIDYQGGRKGAPQYDVASLLFDAKISITSGNRQQLFDYYCEKFCSFSGDEKSRLSERYYGFALIRLMQALGAFGLRGLYENKPTFTESIVPGVNLLAQVFEKIENHISLPELSKVVASLPDSDIYKKLFTLKL